MNTFNITNRGDVFQFGGGSATLHDINIRRGGLGHPRGFTPVDNVIMTPRASHVFCIKRGDAR